MLHIQADALLTPVATGYVAGCSTVFGRVLAHGGQALLFSPLLGPELLGPPARCPCSTFFFAFFGGLCSPANMDCTNKLVALFYQVAIEWVWIGGLDLDLNLWFLQRANGKPPQTTNPHHQLEAESRFRIFRE